MKCSLCQEDAENVLILQTPDNVSPAGGVLQKEFIVCDYCTEVFLDWIEDQKDYSEEE